VALINASTKKHVFGGEGTVAGMDRQTLACSWGVMLHSNFALNLTARQYGAFVLPDAAPGRVLISRLERAR